MCGLHAAASVVHICGTLALSGDIVFFVYGFAVFSISSLCLGLLIKTQPQGEPKELQEPKELPEVDPETPTRGEGQNASIGGEGHSMPHQAPQVSVVGDSYNVPHHEAPPVQGSEQPPVDHARAASAASDASVADSAAGSAPAPDPTEPGVHHLTIGDDATILEGLRGLLAHHLRRSNVVCLSESQAELLEHHLTRLSSYSQKIVHTIAFAQRVFSKGVAEEPSQAEHSQQQEAPEEPPNKRKPLKLSDNEILKMYNLAQQEAELEADWRGIHYMGQQHADFTSAGGSSKPSSRGIDSGRRQERREAIELLGQAFAVRDSRNAPLAGDLAERLVPVRKPRPCDDMLAGTDPGYICCEPLPSSEDTDRAQSNGQAIPELAKVRQQRAVGRELRTNADGSLVAQSEGGVVLTVSSADVRSWLENRVNPSQDVGRDAGSQVPQMSIEVRAGTGDPIE